MKLSKRKIVEFVVVIGVSVGVMYYIRTSSTKLGTDTKIVTVEVVKKKKTKTVVTKKPDGTTRTETTVTDVTDTKQKVKDTVVAAPVSKKTSINALAGLDTTHNFTPVYGLSVTREVLGPVTVGAFGLTNGIVGVSFGVSF